MKFIVNTDYVVMTTIVFKYNVFIDLWVVVSFFVAKLSALWRQYIFAIENYLDYLDMENQFMLLKIF